MSLRPSEVTERRRRHFKSSVNAGEGRRRRLIITDGIRKESSQSALSEESIEEVAPSADPAALKLADLPQLVAGLFSDDVTVQFEATREFKKLLSIGTDSPIQEVINCGVVPCFLGFLSREDCPQLQLEAAWVLTNIASGTSENTKEIVDRGALPLFMKLLNSPNEDVCEQALKALGNIASDSVKCRDTVLEHGVLVLLLQLLNGNPRLSLLRKACWLLNTLCGGKPEPSFEHMKLAILVLRQLIHSEDEEVISDACLSLYFLTISGDANANIQSIIEAGACPRLVELLAHPSTSVLALSLRMVGNIVAGNHVQTQCIIDHQALPRLLNLLKTNQEKSIKKLACCVISNITAGNHEQIQAVINGNIIGPLVHLMRTAQFDISKEAARAISNATSHGTHDQIKNIVSQGCISALCKFLHHSDITILVVCLEGLENILKVGEAEKSAGAFDVNMYVRMIEDTGGFEKIEDLQNHDDEMIYGMAIHLLETFWIEEEDDAMPLDSEKVAPLVSF